MGICLFKVEVPLTDLAKEIETMFHGKAVPFPQVNDDTGFKKLIMKKKSHTGRKSRKGWRNFLDATTCALVLLVPKDTVRVNEVKEKLMKFDLDHKIQDHGFRGLRNKDMKFVPCCQAMDPDVIECLRSACPEL